MKNRNIKIKAGVFVVALLFLATTVTVNANSPLGHIDYIKRLDTPDDTTHIYVCDDTDAQGYEGSDSDGGFNDDGGEFTSGDYTKISVDDSNQIGDCDTDKGQYQYHRFNFTIAESIDVITQIDITWKGYGGIYDNHIPPNYTYGHSFWVKDSSSWSEKDSGTSSSKETLTVQKTADFSDWIVDGHLECAAQSDYPTVVVGEPPYECPIETSFLRSYYIEVKITYIPEYQVLWHRTWFNGDEIHGEAGRVAVDSYNNVITCGEDNYNDPVLIKYSPSGTELWNLTPTPVDLAEPVDLATLDPDFEPTRAIYEMTPEQQETFLDGVFSTQLWDVVCDSQDNIISCGYRVNTEETSSIIIIVKHDPDGNQLWNTTYSYLPDENGFAMGAAVAVDSNDNIYVAGTAMLDEITSISANGVAIKLGKLYGVTHWVKIHSDVFPRVYTGVDVNVDSTEHPFFTGYKVKVEIEPPSMEYTTVALELEKYTGWILNENYIENDLFVTAMVVDHENRRIYVVGSIGWDVVPGDGLIVKLDFSLNVIYQSMTPNDHFQDVAIFDDERLVLGSYRIGNQYTIGIHSKENGIRLAKYKIGTVSETSNHHVTSTVGVAVDSNRDVLASGGKGAIDTIKVRIFDDIIKCTPLGEPEDDLSE